MFRLTFSKTISEWYKGLNYRVQRTKLAIIAFNYCPEVRGSEAKAKNTRLFWAWLGNKCLSRARLRLGCVGLG
jgi:hypothetical protein